MKQKHWTSEVLNKSNNISDTVETYEIKIWVGFQEEYDGVHYSMPELKKICEEFCNEVKLCVTINPTEFVYVNGSEPGAWIGFVNYPRFPREEQDLRNLAFKLAGKVMHAFGQFRVSVVTPEMTYLLKNNSK